MNPYNRNTATFGGVLRENRVIKRGHCDENRNTSAKYETLVKKFQQVAAENVRLKADYVNVCRLHDNIKDKNETLEKENRNLEEKFQNAMVTSATDCSTCTKYVQEIHEKEEQINLLEAKITRRNASLLRFNEWSLVTKREMKKLDKSREKVVKELNVTKATSKRKEKEIENCRRIISDRCNEAIENNILIEKLESELLFKNDEIKTYTDTISILCQNDQKKDEKILKLREESYQIQKLRDEIMEKENVIYNYQKSVQLKDGQIYKLINEANENKAELIKVQEIVTKLESQKGEQIQKFQHEASNLKKLLSCQVSCCQDQLVRILELEKQVKAMSSTREENSSLAKKLEESKIQLQEAKILCNDACQKLANVEKAYSAEKMKLEGILKKLTTDIKTAKKNIKLLTSFVEDVKIAVKWNENENYSLVFQLPELLQHVKTRIAFTKKLNEAFIKCAEKRRQQKEASLSELAQVASAPESMPKNETGTIEPKLTITSHERMNELTSLATEEMNSDEEFVDVVSVDKVDISW